jgi:hypothetical protein
MSLVPATKKFRWPSGEIPAPVEAVDAVGAHFLVVAGGDDLEQLDQLGGVGFSSGTAWK